MLRTLAMTTCCALLCLPACGGKSGAAPSDGGSDMADLGPCTPEVPWDEAHAVFVSAAHGESGATADGTMAHPYATLAEGLAALTATRTELVLDEGTYQEEVKLPARAAADPPFGIHGGYLDTDGAWTRDCEGTPADLRARTVLASPTGVGVRAEGVLNGSSIDNVKIAPDAPAAAAEGEPGRSSYGVYVTGDDAHLVLENVEIKAAPGGAGGAATTAGAAAGASCDGHADCNDGTAGSAGADGDEAAAGAFDDAGWQPASGTDGTAGTDGRNGTLGGMGQTGSDVTTCTAQACAGILCGGAAACMPGTTAKTAPNGTCGCAGKGAGGGGAGQGGGASVGIFVSGMNAKVELKASKVASSAGGAGSAGAEGGSAGAATNGEEGADLTINTACTGTAACTLACSYSSNTCAPGTPSMLTGGSAGGNGGAGGAGGSGGGGAGGASCGTAVVGTATVTADGASLVTPGQAGTGAGGAPDGVAMDHCVPAA